MQKAVILSNAKNLWEVLIFKMIRFTQDDIKTNAKCTLRKNRRDELYEPDY